MKIIIWVSSILLADIIRYFLHKTGIIAGAIPTMIIYGIMIFAFAPFLCKKFDKKKNRKNGVDPVEDFEQLEIQMPVDSKNEFAKDYINKNNNITKIAIIILGFTCIFLSIICARLCFSRNDIIAQNNVLIEENKKINKSWEARYSYKCDELERIENRMSKINAEFNFWRNSAVIVTTTGEKYHTYGCPHIVDRKYWIYNKELAIHKGYEPCLDCIKK